jgi:metal-dependent hydrolase (beta-lactamase superfamily II)
MEKKVDRRDFLKATAVSGTVFLAGDIVQGRAFAQGSVKITGVEKVHAVIGGCHLTGADPEVIQKTIADIKAMQPDYVVPMHCTGFEAIAAFGREMPDQFILNTAGTRYIIA